MRFNRFTILSALLALSLPLWGQKKALTPEDIMAFKDMSHLTLTEDGTWLALTRQPDRGDSDVLIRPVEGQQRYSIDRGSRPVFNRDGRWAAAEVLPEETLIKEKQTPKGLALIETATGARYDLPHLETFEFSPDGRWLAVRQKLPKGKGDKKELRPVRLFMPGTGDTLTLMDVTQMAFDSTGHWLAYALEDSSGSGNGLYAVDLTQSEPKGVSVKALASHSVNRLAWHHATGRLAFASTSPDTGDAEVTATVWMWEAGQNHIKTVVQPEQISKEWALALKTPISWSQDGKRLFTGVVRPQPHESKTEKDTSGLVDPFDREAILKGRGVDVWHWDDEFISPQQKLMWPRVKGKTYTMVTDLKKKSHLVLADEDLPTVRPDDHVRYLLASSDKPYRKLVTWEGGFSDIYLVSLRDGERIKVAEKLDGRASYSPLGRYVAYFENRHWHLFDVKKRQTMNLTENMETPFYDEDHDYPSEVGGYGVAGWTADNKSVLIYDKYDIWRFDLAAGFADCLTRGAGRKSLRTFRIVDTDDRIKTVDDRERLLLSAYHQMEKNFGFYELLPDSEPKVLLETAHKYTFVGKPREGSRLFYTRERYTEFPDVWTAKADFSDARKLTELNPQIRDFAWGSAELVSWHSADGIPLQGVLIKPGNYEEGKRYPVLVYYYRFFSQRLHEFNAMDVNHRPNFPFFASNGYCVFLPDVRFDIGLPGPAATKCLVPGVQKLIDMGIADPHGICLHGHSWSGYQTAFVVTQTDIFTCAIAGAPVSNMTSAYGGIRYGTGMARQFQYEQSQSRIGKTLWDGRDLYIENSPLFFADRINTPLLIMSGDADGAVPWTQSIELYLAMRRLEKPAVFLQYRDEPHHPQKYANKLDYTLRFKEFVDHFCKGAPAPEWWSRGVPYEGK